MIIIANMMESFNAKRILILFLELQKVMNRIDCIDQNYVNSNTKDSDRLNLTKLLLNQKIMNKILLNLPFV